MSGQPSEQPGPTPSATRGWQLAVVAVVLAAVALCAFLPVTAFSTLVVGIVAFTWGGGMLERVGALEPIVFREAFALARAVLIVGGLAALQAVTRPHASVAAKGSEQQPTASAWPWRWPWFVLGAALMLVDAKLIPGAGEVSTVPGVAGAAILATAGWVTLTVPYLLFRLGKAVLRLAWRLSRASPFGAGVVTVGGAGCVAIMLALGAVAGIGSEATAAESGDVCEVGESTVDCSRRLLAATNQRGGSLWEQSFAAPSRQRESSSAATLFASSGAGLSGALSGSGGGGPPSSFAQCLEAYEANPSLKRRVLTIAERIVGDADAYDVVGQTLLDVCLHPRALERLEPFLIRSVQNRALNWRRDLGTGRRCSLDLAPEPICDVRPDEAYVREETQRAVKRAFCALSEEDRMVLLLRYFDGLGEAEIARRMGISYAAARKRLERARDRLRREFHQRCQ